MSVYVIALDRVPASSLGCYGSWQHATPQLDAQAARSLVCDGYYDFWPTSLEVVESAELHLLMFTPEDILDEVTEEDWLAGAAAWLGAAQEQVEDVPDLMEAFLLQPGVLADVDLTLRLALHATALRVLDRLFGELRDELQPHLQPGDAVIVVGRQGEPLVEREAGLEEQPQVCPELQHQPLLIECVTASFRPERLGDPVGRQDLENLLTALIANCDSLFTWQQHVAQRAVAIHATATHRVLRSRQWLCVLPHDDDLMPALYHQPEDQWALMNVAAQYPHVVDALRQVPR